MSARRQPPRPDAVTDQPHAAPAAVNELKPGRGYRPELQGLRAVACALVVVYHVWLGRISGGVDVFFLISGFLITGQLVRAAGRGKISFRPIWGRMITRLFPATLTVLLATVAVSVAVLPESRWIQTVREVVASALYMENWRLAADSVDYFNQTNDASVVQHFWSLSIQGQFYLIWPLLVALVALGARRVRVGLPAGLGAVFVVLFGVSLAYSVWLTDLNQPLAYFHSLTRVWEFALGGLLALAIDTFALPRLVRIILGWTGLAGLASCGLVLQVGTVFPGYLALWPTLSAAMVLIAGATGSRVGADRILSSRPLEYLGNLSFALYLWHWPVLVLYLVARDRTAVGPVGGVGIIGLALLLAAATYHLVENPTRHAYTPARTPWGAYRLGVLGLASLLLATFAWGWVGQRQAQVETIAPDDPDHPGAMAMVPGFPYPGNPEVALAPSLAGVSSDWSDLEPGCVDSPFGPEQIDACTTTTPDQPARRIVLVGDSHARQYMAALRPAAQQRNWQVTLLFRSGCAFSTDLDGDPGDTGCAEWNAATVDAIRMMHPDAVITLASREVRVGDTEQTPPGYLAQWQNLADEGIPVVGVRDNPRYDFSPSACVETRGLDDPTCSTPRASILPTDPPYTAIADPPDVSFLDFSDYFCNQTTCPPVIGNVLVYLDDNHISATYLSTMAPILGNAIATTLGWGEPDQTLMPEMTH